MASVVICAYTEARWDALVRSVRSALEQTVVPAEVILCIDHNDALARRASAQFRFQPLVHVVRSTGPRGLSGARNTGWMHASGEIVVFLDDDAWAEPDWLEELLRPYADERVVGVGGCVEAAWVDVRPRWFPEQFDWVVGCTYRGMPVADDATVRNPIGANMSFRRGVLDVVGGFRPELGRIANRPAGCEETELCIRLTAAVPESRLVYAVDARVHHQVPADRGRVRYFGRRCYAEGCSKALVAQRVGSRDGLSSERQYVFTVLTRAARQELATVTLDGLLRSGAIAAGLGLTGLGYVSTLARAAAATS